MDDKLSFRLRIDLPRGVPVVAFAALANALEGVVRAFVRAVGLDDGEVELWVDGSEEGLTEDALKQWTEVDKAVDILAAWMVDCPHRVCDDVTPDVARRYWRRMALAEAEKGAEPDGR